MTTDQTARSRLTERARQLYVTARPWSEESIAIRNRDQAEMLRDYVHRGDTVLDVGCGTGYLGTRVAERFGAEVTGLDVQDIRAVDIPFQLFDGLTIPLPDQSFDHVVLSFTLHHCQDPLTMLKECRRVARRTVLAFEDLPSGRFGQLLVTLHVEQFRRQYKLEHRGGDYRGALKWLRTQSHDVTRAPMPKEWFDYLYVPRYLLAYELDAL
jgi:ubiquinone/menaquinone biosynthesis C-methylase UbiE